MKHVLTICLAFLFLTADAQKKAPTPQDSTKKATPQVFTISGEAQAFNFLLYVLDNPGKVTHLEATQLRDWIKEQLQKQAAKEGPK